MRVTQVVEFVAKPFRRRSMIVSPSGVPPGVYAFPWMTRRKVRRPPAPELRRAKRRGAIIPSEVVPPASVPRGHGYEIQGWTPSIYGLDLVVLEPLRKRES